MVSPPRVVAPANSPQLRLDSALLLRFFEKMLLIRTFEDRVHESFQKGLIAGTTHLCHGQEAVCVGAIETLGDGDTLTYTYRGHGPVLARGMDPEVAFAEIFGRETGCSRGLGGSMHLADLRLGLLGSFAIVGAGLPVAAGAAISAQLNERGQVAMTFFGDGSTNIGAFHETMNLAAVWKLPLIFMCENNLYGEYSPILTTTPFEDLVRRADAYAMPGFVVDGNDVVAIYRVVSDAVARARAGAGPSFIECKTYRYRGHSRSDPAKYRPAGELEQWLAKDPLDTFERRMQSEFSVPSDEIESVRERVARTIAEALERATAAPMPTPRDLSHECLSGS